MALDRARTLVVGVAALLVGIGNTEAAASGWSHGCTRAQLPGEFPERRFRSAFPSPVAEERHELREKYLLGDWLGPRATLAEHGINLTVLFITDPFGNVHGGEKLGFADYNLVGVDLVIDLGKLVTINSVGGEEFLGSEYFKAFTS